VQELTFCIKLLISVTLVFNSLLLSKYVFDYQMDNPPLVWLGGLLGGLLSMSVWLWGV